jgi:hypothetical protein
MLDRSYPCEGRFRGPDPLPSPGLLQGYFGRVDIDHFGPVDVDGCWLDRSDPSSPRSRETGLGVDEPLSEQSTGHLVVNTRREADRGGLM